MTEDERSVVSFNEIFDQQKNARLTTGVVNRPALFTARLMAWEGAVWGVAYVIHRGPGWQNISNKFQ
jgi:hypothetical protein